MLKGGQSRMVFINVLLVGRSVPMGLQQKGLVDLGVVGLRMVMLMMGASRLETRSIVGIIFSGGRFN